MSLENKFYKSYSKDDCSLYGPFTLDELIQIRCNPKSLIEIKINLEWQDLKWYESIGACDKYGCMIFDNDIVTIFNGKTETFVMFCNDTFSYITERCNEAESEDFHWSTVVKVIGHIEMETYIINNKINDG